MPIGNSFNTSPENLNGLAGQYATQFRDNALNFQEFALWFNTLTLGQVETVFGITTAEATQLTNLVGYMSTLAGVYLGTASQPTNFNFNNALSPLWGGQ